MQQLTPEALIYVYYPHGNVWLEKIRAKKCGHMVWQKAGADRQYCLECSFKRLIRGARPR